LLSLEEVRVVFNKGSVTETVALSNVNLEVRKGDYVTIIGSNGAGKTTMIEAISGTVPTESGRITFLDQDVTRQPDYQRACRIGRVFQNPLAGTAPLMSIEENLALASLRGRRRTLRLGVSSRRRREFRDLLGELGIGLENRLSDPVALLSGGQRQCLTLLMATLCKPHLLLLDEHTAALDPKNQELVMRITDQTIADNDLSALMVTHNMSHALQHGNRTVMMHRGTIVAMFGAQEKSHLTAKCLVEKFHELQGAELDDRTLLV
jgi:putative tryptophan/tyrosine transport system ATP-binding protein